MQIGGSFDPAKLAAIAAEKTKIESGGDDYVFPTKQLVGSEDTTTPKRS